jgi:BASS family bile acid:Na+ symporter
LLFVSGNEPLSVDTTRIAGTLLVTQLLPLGVGVAVRQWRPLLAKRLQKPGNRISKVLNLAVVGFILVVHYDLLTEIRLRGYVGMLTLLLASWAAGWLLGGPDGGIRKALTLTTSLRNVGVGLVIATGAFAGTPAVTAALVYGLIEVVGSLLLAVWWARSGAATIRNTGKSELQPAPVEPLEKDTQS